jgi:hypothetical protein
MQPGELASALTALVGVSDLPPGALNAASFVGQVLGLEEGGDDQGGDDSEGEAKERDVGSEA